MNDETTIDIEDVATNISSDTESISTDTIENIIEVETAEPVTLETIHNDLGIICTFLVILSFIVLCKLIYKFFNIFF